MVIAFAITVMILNQTANSDSTCYRSCCFI